LRMRIRTYRSHVLIRYAEGDPALPAIWCLHGFGASGTSFLEAFEASALAPYAIRVPDFPGFGASPEGDKPLTIPEAAEFLGEMIHEDPAAGGVVLLAHSAGSLVAALAAPSLAKVRGLISVEGNVTAADTFITARAAQAVNIGAWRMGFIQRQGNLEQMDEATRRYCSDLLMATPSSLRSWAGSTVEETGSTRGGESLAAAACPKLYTHGAPEVPEATRIFLASHGIPSLGFARSGHSPMVDQPVEFYEAVAGFIRETGA
jgi:pimeloyl-ACP methyl ester carboxylesterase